MKPTRVWARNYGPWPEVSWPIQEGVTAIVARNESGEGISSNGSGKTTLLNLMPLSLYGTTEPWTDYITTGSTDPSCEVGCEFEHAGNLYRVRRTYTTAGGGGTKTDFELWQDTPLHSGDDEGPRWVTLSQEKQSATQELIRDLIGVGEATFHQTVFSAAEIAHFADSRITAAARSAILGDALGLDAYDVFKERAGDDRKKLQSDLEALRGQLGEWEQQLAGRDAAATDLVTADEQVKSLEDDLATAKELHAKLDERYRTAREARTQIDAATRECETAQNAAKELDRQQVAAIAARGEAVSITAQLTGFEKVAAETEQREAAVAGLRAGDETREAAQRQHDALTEERQAEVDAQQRFERADVGLMRQHGEKIAARDLLKAQGTGACPRCAQPLGVAETQTELATLASEADDLAKEAETARTSAAGHAGRAAAITVMLADAKIPEPPDPAALEAAETSLAQAKAAGDEVTRLTERRANLQAQATILDDGEFAGRLEDAKAVATAAATRVAELEAAALPEEVVSRLAADTLGAEVAAQSLDTQLAAARTSAGAAAERVRTLEEIAARNAKAIGEANVIAFDLEVCKELEKAYGRAGIPVLKLETLYIPQIEQEADRILAAWGVPYRVELVTQKQNKTSATVRDTLEVLIHEPRGTRRYRTYSGGEHDRINVALRIAFARVLRHRRGAALDVFALDELAHLDEAGIDKLAELLEELQREIPIVLFISHSSQLTDAFHQRVTVVRDGEVSRLEAAA